MFPERRVTKTPMRKTNGGCRIGFYPRLVTVWRDSGKEEVPTVKEDDCWTERMSEGLDLNLNYGGQRFKLSKL